MTNIWREDQRLSSYTHHPLFLYAAQTDRKIAYDLHQPGEKTGECVATPSSTLPVKCKLHRPTGRLFMIMTHIKLERRPETL